jgi:Ran GTPase-activating protein (RanGAP) involved in mRNA processing and transport
MESLQEALKLRRGRPNTADQTLYKQQFSLHRHSALSDQDVEKRIQDEVSALTNITEETNLLKEIKDILDELSSILLILKEQELVVQSMISEDDLDPEDEETQELNRSPTNKAGKKARESRSHSRLMRHIKNHEHDIKLLELEALRTHDAVRNKPHPPTIIR